MRPMKHPFLSISLLALAPLIFSTNAHAFGRKMVADESGKIHIASNVSGEQSDMILKDLKRLSTTGVSVDEDMKKVMGLNEGAAAENMRDWLADRVQYIVGENYNLNSNVRLMEASWAYENADELPTVEQPSAKLKTPDGLDETEASAADGIVIPNVPVDADGKVYTVMSNIGSAVYYAGKLKGMLIGLKIPGGDTLPMSSPRSGVIMVGEGLFMPLLKKRGLEGDNVDTAAYAYFRLSTFFHEARHSDGHGKSLGFFHALCPKGHDYENINACDRNLNGPYKVGAITMKNFLVNCKDCSIKELEAMKLAFLDSENRIILETPAPASSNSGTLQAICDTYRDMNRTLTNAGAQPMPLPDYCTTPAADGEKTAIASTFWDDAPEGKRLEAR